MSDDARCDICRKPGRRPRGKHSPEGWFYGEVLSEDADGGGPTVVWACSVECRDQFWLLGPGDLRTSPPYIVRPKANLDVNEAIEATGDALPGTRYTLVLSTQDGITLRVVMPVEPCGRKQWGHWTPEGYRILNEQQVWETPEAAIEAEFLLLKEASRGKLDP